METMPDKTDFLYELNVKYLGELRQLGLGTAGGINTNKSTAEINQAIARLVEIIRRTEDNKHYSCIDDRRCTGNCDNGAILLRPGQAGGGLSPTMAALYSNSDIVKDFQNIEPNALIWALSIEVGKLIQVLPSSHTGGCGAATKLLESTETISNSENLKIATQTLVESLADDKDYKGFGFNEVHYEEIQQNACLLLPTLDGWVANEYTQNTQKVEPNGVEKLEHDAQQPHHGHKSDVIFVVKGGGASIPRDLIPSIGLSGGFVWNVDESLRSSALLAGRKGLEGANKAFLANIAWHLATASSLVENQHIVLAKANEYSLTNVA